MAGDMFPKQPRMVVDLSKSRRILSEHLPPFLRGWFVVIWPFLALLSVFYGFGVRLNALAYRLGFKKQTRLGVPVISIGNLTTGGTGKTPCTELVGRHLRELGLRVAILSRGYGSKNGQPNDEAQVLEENLPDVPHLQGADRVLTGHIAIDELDSEVILLDDGMQHLPLFRDLEIVLIDATEPFGGDWLLPAGLLREPKAGLRRADAILLTRCDLVESCHLENLQKQLGRLCPKAVIAWSIHEPKGWMDGYLPGEPLDLTDHPEGPVAAFCGIGNPEGFQASLERLGLKVCDLKRFPDHHAYTAEDVSALESWAESLPQGTWIATTQKDLVKLRVGELGSRKLLALRIGIRLTQGGERFLALIDRKGLGGADPMGFEPVPSPSTLPGPEMALNTSNNAPHTDIENRDLGNPRIHPKALSAV